MLTKKQKQILDYIKKYIKENDYSPSLQEIGEKFKLSSVATVHQHVNNLKEKGYLEKIENHPRSIELKKKKRISDLVEIPLLGTIAAGRPIDAVEEKEKIKVSNNLISKSGENFALKVQGDSMIGEGIFDGDTVIIKKQDTANNGETVVALLDNNEVTLKKIYKEKNGFRLQPANPNLKPIFTKELQVQGKVISVIRRLNDEQIIYPKRKNGLNKERKVKDREFKELIRGGTKNSNKIVSIKKSKNIEKFINKIICNDSEKTLKKIPDNSIDIIVTSPPYNFGLDYDNQSDAIKWEKYFEKLNRIWIESVRVLKPGGRLCLNVQPLFSDYIPTHHYFSNQLINLGLLWKGEILWEKNNYNCKYTAWGSWKSPSMPYLKYTWEFIEIFCKETHKKTGDSQNIDITGDQFKKWVYAKWNIAPERNMKKYNHPAMFPEELVARLLKLFSYQEDIVLDPFNGVGTTTTVAKKLNRKYIGIDVSKEYCNSANNRINETLF